MEPTTPSLASAPRDTQFQVSLLRLMYPDSKISAHVAELEQMPAYASLARS